MIDRLAAPLRPHFTAIGTACTRDLAMQIASGAIVYGIIWYHGYHIQAYIGFGFLLISETMILRMFRRKAPFQRWTKDGILIGAFVIAALNNIVYLLPALYMAMLPSLALNVAALLWVLGIQIYTVNMWSRLPAFLYASLVPSMLITVLTVFQMSTITPQVSSLGEWVLASFFVVLFIYATIDSLRHHLATERDLIGAQAESARRLSRLEENQRLDPLTQLLNRPAFDAALQVILTDRLIAGGEVAVFLVDLDNFKPINDTYSHEAGDRLLTETAARISDCVGANGIVGRMGGDEFICAIPDLDTTAQAMDFAYDINAVIGDRILWNDLSLKISASIGVAFTGKSLDGSGDTVQSLCSSADQAMFAAKTSANTNPVLFDADQFAPSMTAIDKQALINAISDKSIRPHYQPKINLVTGQVIGFEALARWHHPDGTIRRPDIFLEPIKELGLQGDFMTCIARQVVEDVKYLLDQNLDPGQVSFNVPEVALATHRGSQDLKQIVTAHEGTAQHLTFEITEDVFIARAADAIQMSIVQFRDMGVRISLDDFGTGFASFHHLRQLDFDEMKIDTSFVEEIGTSSTADVLVRGFLDIASGLGVSVIAEGVETQAQRTELQNMGCLIAQGYLFSRAMPIDQVEELLTKAKTA